MAGAEDPKNDRSSNDNLVPVRKDRIRAMKVSSIQVGGWFSETRQERKARRDQESRSTLTDE